MKDGKGVKREKLLSQDSLINRNESEEQITLPSLKTLPENPPGGTTVDFSKKKASIHQLAFDPQSSVINGHPYQFSVISGMTQGHFVERLHKPQQKMYEGNGHLPSTKMPPYLAMKKMILE